METRDLTRLFPRLWHMADPQNLEGIKRHGLLSTSALLHLYEYPDEARREIERAHRPQSVIIDHAVHGPAVVRDQKPLTVDGLRKSLPKGVSPEQFLHFLNRRVFFWLTERRLARMNEAKAYRTMEKLVLIVDTASLVQRYEDRILLSPMNSGATLPMPHPRSISMFRSIADYDYASVARKRDPIVELTVEGGVPDILEHVRGMEIWKAGVLVKTVPIT